MILSLSLLLGLVGMQAPGAAPGFQPDEHLTPPGGPEIVLFRSVPPEVVSLRLSVPIEEAPEEAGAAQLLRVQAQDRMQVLAARIGARAEVHRTPQALVYELSGSAADLDFLAWILREGLRAPEASDFEGARRQVQAELDRTLETPQGVLFQRVRESLLPGTAPLAGTSGSLDRMDALRLEGIWARTHRRDRFRLVIATRLSTATILAAMEDLGLPADAPVPSMAPPPESGATRPAPEVIRHWIVDAWPIPGVSEARTLVAARWMGEHLRTLNGDFEAGVELWDLGDSRALVLAGAAYPRSRSTMESRVRATPVDAAATLSEDAVRRIAGELRAEILLAARTPWGLTDLVGQAWDTGHGAEGVETLLEELATLSAGQVRVFLEGLAAIPPVREALNP